MAEEDNDFLKHLDDKIERGEDLTHEERMRLKHGPQGVEYIKGPEYKRKLGIIVAETENLLREEQKTSQEEFGKPYEIVGIIIFGSWAQGVVHKESDLDIEPMVTQDPVDLPHDFSEKLEERLKGRGVKIEIECHNTPVYTDDKAEIEKIVSGNEEFTKPGFIVISPDQWVKDLFRKPQE